LQEAFGVAAHFCRRHLADDDAPYDSKSIDEDVDREAVYSVLIAQRSAVDNDGIR
jgi:hypothetical protein